MSDLVISQEARRDNGLPATHGKLVLGQLRSVPSPADCLHQQDTGIHAAALNVDVVALVGQSRSLGRDHLKVVSTPPSYGLVSRATEPSISLNIGNDGLRATVAFEISRVIGAPNAPRGVV
jgi:hypothetical protein